MTEETYNPDCEATFQPFVGFNFVITTDLPVMSDIPEVEKETKVEKKKFIPKGCVMPGSATVTLGSETVNGNDK